MNRRQFLRTGVIVAAASTLAGRVGAQNEDDGDEEFPTYELPDYSQWVPAESHTDPETGVFFTHVDWETVMALNGGENPDDELDDELEDELEELEDELEELGEVVEQMPILGLPLYGAFLTPFALITLLFYPFVEDIIADNSGDIDGIDTTTITMADELVIFHGEYDRDLFEEQYTDGFEEAEEREDFTVYVGADVLTEGLAFALSNDILIAGMMPGGEDEFVPEDIVYEALNRYLEETDRVVDDEEGVWLFETTGDASMAFGAWETDDLVGALEPDVDNIDDVEDQEQDDQGPDTDPDIDDDNPVFDTVESVVNSLVFDVDDGEILTIEARFAGRYPEDAVPSESEVEEHLIGEEDVPHEIVIQNRRVHATVTFDEELEE